MASGQFKNGGFGFRVSIEELGSGTDEGKRFPNACRLDRLSKLRQSLDFSGMVK